MDFFAYKVAPRVYRTTDSRTRIMIVMGTAIGALGYFLYSNWNNLFPTLEPALNNDNDDVEYLTKKFEKITLDSEKEKTRRLVIAQKYQDYIEKMSLMIISGEETESPSIIPRPSPTFSNLEGYGSWSIQTKAVSVNYKGKVYPIGYHGYIPTGINKVDNVILSAYGGDTQNDKETTIYSIAGSTELFVSENCTVIELFLPDLLQNTTQQNMTQELHMTFLKMQLNIMRLCSENYIENSMNLMQSH